MELLEQRDCGTPYFWIFILGALLFLTSCSAQKESQSLLFEPGILYQQVVAEATRAYEDGYIDGQELAGVLDNAWRYFMLPVNSKAKADVARGLNLSLEGIQKRRRSGGT